MENERHKKRVRPTIAMIRDLENQIQEEKNKTQWAEDRLADERKFTETFARMLQLVTLIDPIRNQDKIVSLDVYGKQNPTFAQGRCCEWTIPTRDNH